MFRGWWVQVKITFSQNKDSQLDSDTFERDRERVWKMWRTFKMKKIKFKIKIMMKAAKGAI